MKRSEKILVFLTTLIMVDLYMRAAFMYIPAYHLKGYIVQKKDTFNKTATKIITIVESTESAVNTFQLFFKGNFLSSICKTEMGQKFLGYLCYFSSDAEARACLESKTCLEKIAQENRGRVKGDHEPKNIL